MRTKTAVSGSLSNKRALTDAEINAGFAFNTILESPDFNGQLFDIDDQVDIISKEICNFLTGHSVTPVGSDNTQLRTLLDSLFNAKQDTLVAGANITIDENNVISTTGAAALNFPLFASMWMYCKPFNTSWVNASNYSWLYASMYVSAYNTLVSQLHPTGKAEQGSTYYVLRFDNGEGETTNVLVGSGTLADLQTYCTAQGYTYNAAGTIDEFECYKTLSSSSETVEGITITYYETYNGMKIITDAAEITNKETLYNLTGVDNYFILDEVNNRFKLPRTQYGFVGLRDKVGKYVPETLPNIKGEMTLDHVIAKDFSGALYETTGGTSNYGHDSYAVTHYVKFNAYYSSDVYQDDAPVQQRATQMYLYFYLGDTGEIVDHQIASIALELFNGKVDLDAQNLNATGKAYVSSLAMPSGIVDHLTLGASETEYTAPADGYFVICKTGNAGNYFYATNTSNSISTIASYPSNNYDCHLFLPFKKGQILHVSYNASGTTNRFYFVHTNGDS